MRWWREDEGQAAFLVVGLFLVAISFLGLAFDMARAFAERSALQARADEAALAATSALAEADLRSGEVRVAAGEAEDSAHSLLASAGLDPAIAVAVTVRADGVEVRLARRVPTTFLRLVGVNDMEVGAQATASPRLARP